MTRSEARRAAQEISRQGDPTVLAHTQREGWCWAVEWAKHYMGITAADVVATFVNGQEES